MNNSSSNFDVADDGNFRRGRFKPAAIGVGVLLVAVAGGFALFAAKGEGARMSDKEVHSEENSILLLSKTEQIPRWRVWALKDSEPTLQQDAFTQLAWAGDVPSIPLIAHGLASPDHRVRGTAAQALLEFGSPLADSTKPALLQAFADANDSDKPQIAWALAVLHESSAFDGVMVEYRAGHLSKVQRLDGNPAFDPSVLAKMVPLDKLATLVGDPSPSVRQLVATALSDSGDAQWLAPLTTLVQDKEIEVAREAAVGLGKIGSDSAMQPLLDALSRADKDSRQKFLEALRDGIGTKGLVLAIGSVNHDSLATEKVQMRVLFEMMKDIEDPRGGDALAAFLLTNPRPHWRTEAALRLAEVGDLRAVPHLAWRLAQDPLKLYNSIDDEELRRDDNERVQSARMLADLAILHPEALADIRTKGEDAVLGWAKSHPQPHANALRFLAVVGSQKALPDMRRWADPSEGLPKLGEKDFSANWATAQSALRYLGWAKDSWALLEKQLNRRPSTVDATKASLAEGGLTVLGMTLRGLGVGASDGFAQWGDPKAFPILTKFVEDPKNNEDSRGAACMALAWVSTPDEMTSIVKKVGTPLDKKNADAADVIRGCYLLTLTRHSQPDASPALLDLVKADTDLEVRHTAARALGLGGLTPAAVATLNGKLTDPNIRSDAALALLLGGTTDDAAHALTAYEGEKDEAAEDLKVMYDRSFGFWSDANYENGDLARWITNADAARHVKVNGALQDWPHEVLARSLDTMTFDNGPHSITRVRLRVLLYRDGKNPDPVKRHGAIAILKFMKEKGVLMALKNDPASPYADEARAAFFEVMNPKLTGDRLPQAATTASANSATGTP